VQVASSGRLVRPGDLITSHTGDEAVFVQVTRNPADGRSARIAIRRLDGSQAEVYAHVYGLAVAPPVPAAFTPQSIWQPVHLGSDETGADAHVTITERNMLIGGEPGSGKSVALQLIVAHAALSLDCQLILIDGKRVELGFWQACAERFVGPSIDDAIETMHWLQTLIDERTELLLQARKRKVTADLGWPLYVVPVDEVAYYSATVGTKAQQNEFNAANRDVVARGRAPGIIPIEATQRPSADIIPTSLRDLFGYRWAFRCSTEASSDTILGHGWATAGYSATDIDPQSRGVSWLRAEDGIPRRVKSAYLTDDDIITLAGHAASLRKQAA
jgi:S-DNA-T family DNA segregation ATPase FtsK/SpoIIIE